MAARASSRGSGGARRAALTSLACLALCGAAEAQRGEWVVGQGHGAWSDVAQRTIALDDTTVAGAIQPFRLRPGVNVIHTGPPDPTGQNRSSVLGYQWAIRRGAMDMAVLEMEVGWNPRLWAGGSATAIGNPALIDGVEDAPGLFGQAPVTGRANPDDWHTLDLAIPLPIDSIAFFPPQKGLHPTLGQLYRDLFPKGYAVSRATDPVGWLLQDEEPADTGRGSAYHALADIVAQTFSNPRSVVGISCPLRFTRFLRFYFGGVAQTFAIAELQAFGRGFPAEARFVSRPIAIAGGRPVSFGTIRWQARPFRLQADGSVVADPEAPVSLRLHTRTGLDEQPQVYHIYDELGTQKVVDKKVYDAAPPPRTIYQMTAAGFRGAITDDTENWDLWSSPYEAPGEQTRSADARSYLQFRFELATDDPLAFVRLDSIAIEYSALLAANAVGEVSVAGHQSAATPGADAVEAGVDTLFVYDLAAVFDAADQPGFDGVRLDVPPGTRLVGMQIGSPPVAVTPDSIGTSADERLEVYFPSHRVTRANNQPVRLLLRGTIFQTSTYFTGEVLDSRGAQLPQTIVPGDANPAVSTNTVQVLSSGTKLSLLQGVSVEPRVITPNGDQVNDRLQIRFGLFGVEAAQVSLEVFALSGRRVAAVPAGTARAGWFAGEWDGTDQVGQKVAPGVYLLRLEVDVDRGKRVAMFPVSVAY